MSRRKSFHGLLLRERERLLQPTPGRSIEAILLREGRGGEGIGGFGMQRRRSGLEIVSLDLIGAWVFGGESPWGLM